MSTKHTPGPWGTETPPVAANRHRYITSPSGAVICDVRCGVGEDCGPFVDSANARLIAAAPELLEACRLALTRLETIERDKGIHSHETIPELRAAIAKAEGR